MYKFKFADIGEGLHEGTVGEIFVKVGDVVAWGDSLFSIETDQNTSVVPSPVSGEVLDIRIKPGDPIHIGDYIFRFDDKIQEKVQQERAWLEKARKEKAKLAKEREEREIQEKAKLAKEKEEKAKLVKEKEEKSMKEKAKEEKAKEEKAQQEAAAENASVVGDVKVSNDVFKANMFATSNSETIKGAAAFVNPRADIKAPIFNIEDIKPTGDGEPVDVVVIGAGPGGYTVAEALGKQKYKVVVIEKEFAGGVCLNVGCIPTKTLLKSAKVLEEIKSAKDYGVNVDIKNLSLNWKKMQERKENVRVKLRNGVQALLKSQRVELVSGEAKVIDKYNVVVDKRKFTTKVIILATGSSPIHLPLPGFDSPEAAKILIDSTGALELGEIPKSLTVIGGGVIGVEFASLYNELGSKVTILEGTSNILGPMDKDVKDFALKMLTDRGIDIKLNARVEGLEKGEIIYDQDGKKHKIKAEKVLESIGRRPNNLGLNNTLGIKVGKRGEFEVNDYMQTSIPNIFAIGDANAKVMLAHVAYKHAHVVANFIKKTPKVWSLDRVPACVYTHPELSSIGKTEQQLKDEGIPYIKSIWQNVNVGKVLADENNALGFTKLLVGKQYGQILGAHIINANSSDMISEIATLIETEGTIYELADTIHPHPSISEVIYEAAVHAVDQLNRLKK